MALARAGGGVDAVAPGMQCMNATIISVASGGRGTSGGRGSEGIRPMRRPQQRQRRFFWPRLVFALVLAFAATRSDAADPSKTLRVVLGIAETSFDPQFASDAASDGIIANIYEAMLDYDYLARPVKLVPRTLEAMPLVQDDGATYVFKLRKGIFFTPDPAFKGKPRELTGAVAPEVVNAYGQDFGAHPVGTGPYMLGEYKRSTKIVLVANPGYRSDTYIPAGPIPADSQAIASALKGKRLPLPGRIEVSII